MGLSKTGSNCLETTMVTGYRRVPVPPARIMPFIRPLNLLFKTLTDSLLRTSWLINPALTWPLSVPSALLMNIIPTDLPEVLIIEPKVFGDQRGFFLETYQFARYAAAGIGRPFVQDNMSRSSYGVLRGLHLQNPMT